MFEVYINRKVDKAIKRSIGYGLPWDVERLITARAKELIAEARPAAIAATELQVDAVVEAHLKRLINRKLAEAIETIKVSDTLIQELVKQINEAQLK